jgi:hypothetical protein
MSKKEQKTDFLDGPQFRSNGVPFYNFRPIEYVLDQDFLDLQMKIYRILDDKILSAMDKYNGNTLDNLIEHGYNVAVSKLDQQKAIHSDEITKLTAARKGHKKRFVDEIVKCKSDIYP